MDFNLEGEVKLSFTVKEYYTQIGTYNSMELPLIVGRTLADWNTAILQKHANKPMLHESL